MTFEEALINIKDGKKIRRKGACSYSHIFLYNDYLIFIDKSTRVIEEAFFNSDDLIADDWEIVE